MRYAALWIAAVIVVVFGLQQVIATDMFVLDVSLMWAEPWRIVLSFFAHSGVEHLLGNLFSLVLFGLILEGTVGPKRVLYLFLASGVIVSLLTPFTPYDRVIGASGAVFAIIGALATLKPRLVMWVDFVPMPMILAGIVYVAIDLFGIFYPSGTANLAHLFGIGIGVVVGLFWRREYEEDPASPSAPSRRRSSDPPIDRELDAYERNVGLR